MSGKDVYPNEKALRIMEALNAVDEELLERCGSYSESVENTGKVTKVSEYRGRQKALWRRGRTWAACLGLLAVGTLTWNGLHWIWAPAGAPQNNFSGSSSGGGMDQNASADTAPAESELTGNAAAKEMNETEGEGAFDTGASDSLFDKEEESLRNEVSDKLGAENSMAQGSGESDADDPICGYPREDSVGANSVEYVTEEEARGWMPLGAFIPRNLPEGYSVESAYIDEEAQSVAMTWLHGTDSILIRVSKVEAQTVETVDISKPETYDQRLYEIPYAETVPEEYRKTVDEPVFDFSDMDRETGLELMRSRMISYDDAGDTDTPRGRFSILIEDEILLYFNGRGTPEEIWAMLYSMKR